MGSIIFLNEKKEDLEFFKILKFDIEDVLINKDKISEILLDIERTVGLILGLYCLLKLKKLNRKFITQIKNFIKQLEDLYWLEYDEFKNPTKKRGLILRNLEDLK
ncbi:MAG: hypothetical protein QXP60_03680 [Nitrososphaerota archaeon]